ncbi:MAG: metallophosphoesterase [candidate division Zixibacteria bacterium]
MGHFKVFPFEVIIHTKNLSQNFILGSSYNRKFKNTVERIHKNTLTGNYGKPIDETKTMGNHRYSFYVAGHTYGTPASWIDAKGLYEPFVEKFDLIRNHESMSFGFLTGDVVRSANNDAWDLVEKDIALLGIKTYIAPGNHDVKLGMSNPQRDLFQQRFGKTYFSFLYNGDLFIVLDPNLDGWNISGKQLDFLKSTLEINQNQVTNIFVFSHQLIWWDIKRLNFASIKPNSLNGRSQNTNFWDEVFPLFSSLNNKVYMFAGDVGAHPKGNELFFTKHKNVSFFASGMGGGYRDNFLIVDVNEKYVYVDVILLN